LSEDDEREYYERYVKSENTIWKRVKRWLSPSKAIQTIHDVDYFDWDMVVKLFCVILLLMIISFTANMIDSIITRIWFWFFPQAQTKGGEWGYFMPALMGVFA